MVDNGQFSTQLMTALGIIATVYLAFQSVINGYLDANGFGYLAGAIGSFMITIYNYSNPRQEGA